VKWISPEGDKWILSNLASQQNLFRVLDGLTTISTRNFGIHVLNSYRTTFLPNSRLTIGAKGHIYAQTFTVSSVDLCIRALFYSLCQCKETMCYGKYDGIENTCKTDDQE
jgi:hypothetical protein